MGLTSWVANDDAYSHDQLAANWDAIDAHDHSGGKGKPIPTGGIQDGAITSAKLATCSVTSGAICDGTIGLQDLSSGLVGSLQPLGSVIFWWRPSMAQAIPASWVVPYGQQLGPTLHDFAGGGTITLPDLTNHFPLGASASDAPGAPATGTSPSTPPAIGATGGGQTIDLRHTHSTTQNSAATDVSTPFATGGTAPGTSSNGDHQHRWSDGAFFHGLSQRGRFVRVTDDVGFQMDQFLYVPGFNSGNLQSLDPDMEVTGAHTHSVNSHSHTVGAHTHPISSQSLSSGNPSPSFSAVDHRPAFVGLLPLLKVKIA